MAKFIMILFFQMMRSAPLWWRSSVTPWMVNEEQCKEVNKKEYKNVHDQECSTVNERVLRRNVKLSMRRKWTEMEEEEGDCENQ